MDKDKFFPDFKDETAEDKATLGWLKLLEDKKNAPGDDSVSQSFDAMDILPAEKLASLAGKAALGGLGAISAMKALRGGMLADEAGALKPISRKQLRDLLYNEPTTIMTFQNPGAQRLNVITNQERLEALMKDLNKRSIDYHKGLGMYGIPEDSLLIPNRNNATKQALEDLGRKYGQESVVHSRPHAGDTLNEMRYVTGDNAGMQHQGKGITVDNKATNYYTQVDKVPDKIKLNIDFDELKHTPDKPQTVFEKLQKLLGNKEDGS